MTAPRTSQPVVWEPHPGPQTTFLMSDAYEALYGGAAGGGKSDSLLFGALRQTGHSQYRALIIRRTFPELQYLIDRSMATFPSIGGQWIASEKRWKFPSGAIVEFGYCISGDALVVMGDWSLRPMRDVRVGDEVMTLDGPSRVSRHFCVGVRPAVAVTVDGITTTVSRHHALLAASGEWETPHKFADHALEAGDKIDHTKASRHTQGTLPPLSWSGRVARATLVSPSSECDNVLVAPVREIGGECDGQGLPSSLADCLTAACSDDVHPHLAGASAQAYTRQQVDAGKCGPMPVRVDDPMKTRGHNHSAGYMYSHPYTKEVRTAVLDVHHAYAEMVQVDDCAFWDMTVVGGNHYITNSGLIHKNCETYSDVQQYQGRQFDYIGVDELGQIADERVWTYLMSRNRASGPGLIRMMRGSANPGGPGHQWIKKRFIDTCPRSGETTRVESVLFDGTKTATTRAFVFARLEDNPTLLENDPTYGERLKQLTETEYRWLGLGDWDAGGGSFYPELGDWQRLLIPASQMPALLDWYEYWASYDWGFVHPASFTQFCRIKDTVYVLDTMSMHRYQDEEQASAIKSASEGRCLRMVFAGHDAFAKRMAHSAAAETVADVFGRYSINLEKANIDREAGAKVLRRFFAKPKPGPQPKGAMKLVVVDTVGNRAALMELAALIPEATRPNVPAKRDADEKGLNGDDLADGWRYGLATPSFEPMEPLPVWKEGNVDTGVDGKPPWEQTFTKTTDTGQIDKRAFIFRPEGPDGDFPEDMT